MKVKNLRVEFINSRDANEFVKKHHYSGKVVQNSQLHFGVFNSRILVGVLSYGPAMDKNRALLQVPGTPRSGMLELNRMAFINQAPKNSESRCLAISIRLIKKHYPFVKWLQTFADATQCGDGTIYRAVGFDLVQVRQNTTICIVDGVMVAKKTLDTHRKDGRYLSSILREEGRLETVPGYQIKYMYFIDPQYKKLFKGEFLPYSKIKELGASMYLGERAKSSSETPANHAGEDGAEPISTLQSKEINGEEIRPKT